jgi:hypothetical protein
MPENSDNAPKGSPLGSQPEWFRRVRQVFVLAVILGVTPAFAADPDNGERLARRWCAACHVVASNQRGPVGEAPPFASIAAKPDFDAAKLAFFLSSYSTPSICLAARAQKVEKIEVSIFQCLLNA